MEWQCLRLQGRTHLLCLSPTGHMPGELRQAGYATNAAQGWQRLLLSSI